MDAKAAVQARVRLTERKRELLGLVEDTEEALAFLEQSRPHEWTEEAQEEALASMLQTVDERVWQELLDIERALVRVDHGTYGICESCGSKIEPRRLKALPAARVCILCQGAASGG